MTENIFAPYQALGLVTKDIPFQIRREGLRYGLMVSLGNSFQIYTSDRLLATMSSSKQDGKIRSMSFYGKESYITTCKNNILFWGGPSVQYILKKHSASVTKILVFDNLLLSLSKNNEFFIWDLDSRMALENQLPTFPANTHTITDFIHPRGYFNKVLIVFESGEMQLWNLKTLKHIYTFKGWNSKITSIEDSPVLDVVAIGLEDGSIICHNLKLDKTIIKFKQIGSVTSLSFRTDGKSFLASSNGSGVISVWDLEKKSLFTNLEAHEGSIARVKFLHEEPIMISNSADNSIKVWAFNGLDGLPVLLRQRSGHSDPPVDIQFYGERNDDMISMSERSIRFLSTDFATLNMALSQKKTKGLKTFRSFSCNHIKNRIWDTIVTCHQSSPKAMTWDCEHRSIGKNSLTSSNGKPITAVCVSSCGHFALLGDAGGCLYKFNIQSGLERGKTTQLESHSSTITSIVCDPTNRFVITSSIDRTIRFFDFTKLTLHKLITLPQPISKMVIHKDSGMIATSCDDMKVRLYDIETQNLAREFGNFKSKVNHMTFNHDGRWLITSSSDLSIRIFDIPSSRMIDWFLLPKPVTSITFSPSGEYLVTTHTNELSVFLWTNQMHFGSVFLKEPSSKPQNLQLPQHLVDKDIMTEKEQQEDDELNQSKLDKGVVFNGDVQKQKEKEKDSKNDGKSKIPQIGHLITLSDTVKSKWQTLLSLDTIKERNKPIQQKQKPQLAPFFLSTMQGLEPKFITPNGVDNNKKENGGGKIENGKQKEKENEENEEELAGWEPKEVYTSDKVIKTTGIDATRTKFNVALEKGYDQKRPNNKYEEAFKILKSMSPSGIDFEIRSLTSFDNHADVHFMFDFIAFRFKTNRDYDFLHSILNLTLKIHGYLLYTPDFQKELKDLSDAIGDNWKNVQSQFHSNVCMLRYFTNTLNN
eukprot:gene1123-1428_t